MSRWEAACVTHAAGKRTLRRSAASGSGADLADEALVIHRVFKDAGGKLGNKETLTQRASHKGQVHFGIRGLDAASFGGGSFQEGFELGGHKPAVLVNDLAACISLAPAPFLNAGFERLCQRLGAKVVAARQIGVAPVRAGLIQGGGETLCQRGEQRRQPPPAECFGILVGFDVAKQFPGLGRGDVGATRHAPRRCQKSELIPDNRGAATRSCGRLTELSATPNASTSSG